MPREESIRTESLPQGKTAGNMQERPDQTQLQIIYKKKVVRKDYGEGKVSVYEPKHTLPFKYCGSSVMAKVYMVALGPESHMLDCMTAYKKYQNES